MAIQELYQPITKKLSSLVKAAAEIYRGPQLEDVRGVVQLVVNSPFPTNVSGLASILVTEDDIDMLSVESDDGKIYRWGDDSSDLVRGDYVTFRRLAVAYESPFEVRDISKLLPGSILSEEERETLYSDVEELILKKREYRGRIYEIELPENEYRNKPNIIFFAEPKGGRKLTKINQ